MNQLAQVVVQRASISAKERSYHTVDSLYTYVLDIGLFRGYHYPNPATCVM